MRRLQAATRSLTYSVRRNSTFAAATRARTDQTLTLPDGRTLGYAEYGAPTGEPLMFFHGFPSSRLEAGFLDEMAHRHQLRVVSPDRPGFGLSSPQQGRRITDWPVDVRALASHLGLPRFAVLGGSGGGPYALACGAAFSRDTLRALGVMAGAPPWESAPGQPLPPDGIQEMTLTRRTMAQMALHAPFALELAAGAFLGLARGTLALGPVQRRLDAMLVDEKTQKDESPSAIEERRRSFIRTIFEGFAQGSGAMVEETRLLTHDWGFRFEDVTSGRVQVWHGSKDRNAPISRIQYMVSRIPDAQLREYDVDHYGIAKYSETILDELTSTAPSEAS